MPVVRYSGGSRYSLRDGPTWEDGDEHEVGDATADRLADRPDFEVLNQQTENESVLVADGICPWCSDYEGDHVGQHASSAHPDKWADYSEVSD